MDTLDNSEILAKWAAGKMMDDEKRSLEDKFNLTDLAYVLNDIDTWSLPKYNTTWKFEELKQLKNAQIVKKQKTIKLSIFYSIAASIAVLIGGFYFYILNTSNIELITQTGESIQQTLPKGSTIHLDANSVARYSKWQWRKSREIELEGQAFFNVTHGSSFAVKTPSGKVEVLGTSFNVYADKDMIQVKCYKGTVQVSSGEVSHVLNKHNGILIKNGQTTELEVEDQSPDWTKGFTRYSSEKLYKVIEDLQKYYQVEIELSQAYQQMEYSGVVVHKDLNTALELIFAPMGISYTLTDNGKVLVNNK